MQWYAWQMTIEFKLYNDGVCVPTTVIKVRIFWGSDHCFWMQRRSIHAAVLSCLPCDQINQDPILWQLWKYVFCIVVQIYLSNSWQKAEGRRRWKKNETCSSLSKEAISIRQFLATELKVGFYFFYFFLWTWKEEVEIAITISCMNIFLTYESSDLPCAAGVVSLIPEVVITL